MTCYMYRISSPCVLSSAQQLRFSEDSAVDMVLFSGAREGSTYAVNNGWVSSGQAVQSAPIVIVMRIMQQTYQSENTVD